MSERMTNPYRQPPIDPQEQDYLDQVQAYITEQIEHMEQDNADRAQQDSEMKEDAWDQHLELKDGAGAADSAVVQHELALNAVVQHEQNTEIKQLRRLWESPYFGRMDLEFSEHDADTFYVGLRELIDTNEMKQYVIDWRSPVASIYYEDETGDVSYMAPAGEQRARLTGRKQIVINRGRLTMVLDGEEQVNDEILQLVLSQKAGTKMKQIVSTLQAEQNEIIRAEPQRTALIQGVAGSGKTSIALHRASYLLYRDRQMASANVLLLSPNPQFSEYISQVLPDLGDENVPALTADQLMRVEVYDADASYRRIRFGSSPAARMDAAGTFEFLAEAKRYAADREAELFTATDIKTPNFTIKAAYLQRLFYSNYQRIAPFERYAAIVEHLAEEYGERKFPRNRDAVEDALRAMYATWSLDELVDGFFASLPTELAVARPETAGKEEVDLVVLAWFKVRFFGSRDMEAVKHLFVDEMQDLFPLQHDLIRRMFSCPKTILGDVNQAVRFTLPYQYLTQLRELYEVGAQLDFYTLNNAYRSTYEITMFSRELIGRPEIQPIERHGEPVLLEHYADDEALLAGNLEQLAAWESAGYRQVAVIASDAEERELVYEQLRSAEELSAVSMKPGEVNGFQVTVLDPESAKGMEFDAVLVWNASAEHYGADLDRTRLYVAVTRALHELAISVVGKTSRWLTS